MSNQIRDIQNAAVPGAGGMANGFHIHVTYAASVNGAPAEFKTAVAAAVHFLQNHFSDPITINVKVAYKSIGSLGQSLTSFTSYTYSQIKTALQADDTTADDSTAVASLPAHDPIGGNHLYFVSTGEAKALGLLGASNALDGTVTFDNTANLFDYDKSDGITAGKYDFFAVVVHEITEVMGRELMVGSGNPHGYSPLDLFHYSAPGTRSFAGSHRGYFSIDGGNTNLKNFNTDPNGDFGDWANNAGNDSFRAFSNSGVVNRVSPADLTEMDVLGYDRSGAAAAANHGAHHPHLIIGASGIVGYHAGEHLVAISDLAAPATGDFA